MDSNGKLNIGEANASIEAHIGLLRLYDATNRAFGMAEQVVSNWLGVPICKTGCGLCCDVTSVTVWDIEARYICSWLAGLGTERSRQFLDLCEGWLLEKHPALTTYGLAGTLSPEQWARLKPEVDSLVYHTPCAMLMPDKSCLAHDARPLVCHAYGTTRMPGKICPRPLSKVESPEVRGHIGSDTPLGKQLRTMVVKVLQEAGKLGLGNARFLPTAVFEIMRPAKFNAYVFDGKIASAKLAVVNNNIAILFQHQLNDVWAQEIAAAKS